MANLNVEITANVFFLRNYPTLKLAKCSAWASQRVYFVEGNQLTRLDYRTREFKVIGVALILLGYFHTQKLLFEPWLPQHPDHILIYCFVVYGIDHQGI